MKMTAKKENLKTLAAALGIVEDEAEILLNASILITFNSGEETGRLLATELELLLKRTVEKATCDESVARLPNIEVVIGNAKPRSGAKNIFVEISKSKIAISEIPKPKSDSVSLHPSLSLLGACYTAAKVLACYLGEAFPYKVDEPLVLDFQELFQDDMHMLHEPIDLETVYLAGAGAVGNGFIYGLRHFDVRGEIHVVDPKIVKDGNLNRCMFFNKEDLDLPKAEQLCKNAQTFFNTVKLVPRSSDLRELPEKSSGPWLKRLVVTVDSRRARRNLQTEIPREVYDASTTGIQEVVLHFNNQPSGEKACLSCIYEQERDELAREGHVAEVLGVGVEKVQEAFIDPKTAKMIADKYPELEAGTIVNMAYDSLFKQLCGQGQLTTAADNQVLAPFAFVSVLAGVMLAVEMVRRVRKGTASEPFNYWRLAPYNAPVVRGRSIRKKIDGCEFCGGSTMPKVVKALWS